MAAVFTPEGYSRLRTTSPDSTSSSSSSPKRLRPSPLPTSRRLLNRTSPVVVLSSILLIIIPLVYTFRHTQVIAPAINLILPGIPAHIPAPSGGTHDIPYTLEARLSYLLSRPALAQWEAELPSRHACPMFTYSRNTYFFHDGEKSGQWESIGPTEIRKYRSKMVEYLRSVEREGNKLVWDRSLEADVPKEERRGLIMTGGDGKTLERIKLSLHMLRNVLGSKIPVEIFHFPDEMVDPAERKALEEEYAVMLKAVGQKRANGKSWNIKNEAFLASQFTEFIYIDSDNIPLRDPALLFDSVEYKQSGSVFWADLNKDHPDNAIFRVVGRYCSDEHWPAEAGQLIFDKRGNNGLNLAVLHLANHMMSEPRLYDMLSYGDKDTFRFAFYALGLDYQQATKIFASAGGYQTQGGETSANFCGHSMIQWGLTPPSAIRDTTYHPEPFFLHTILAKHRDGLQPSKLFTHIRRPRMDNINEPLLVRTLYEFTGDCFAINLKGPDGASNAENSMGDGQGVVMVQMRDVVGKKVWAALEELSEKFVAINA